MFFPQKISLFMAIIYIPSISVGSFQHNVAINPIINFEIFKKSHHSIFDWKKYDFFVFYPLYFA